MKKLIFAAASAAALLTHASAATVTETTPTAPATAFTNVDDMLLASLGFDPARALIIDFDTDADGNPIASGTTLNSQYASQGVTISGGLQAVNWTYQGPVSSPNTTYSDGGADQIFTFDRAVRRVGIINTSPDGDNYEVFDADGNSLGSTTDQGDGAIDSFIVFEALPGEEILQLVVTGIGGRTPDGQFNIGLELDNLVVEFAPVPIPGAAALFTAGALFLRRKRAA